MKKFILAISVIIAAIANAVTCNWSGNNIAFYASGDSATSYSVYLLDASVTSASAMATALSVGDTSLIAAATVAETSGIAQDTTAVRWSKTDFGNYTAGDDASWTLYDTSAETPVYTLGETDFKFDAGDAVRFFKAAVADEP